MEKFKCTLCNKFIKSAITLFHLIRDGEPISDYSVMYAFREIDIMDVLQLFPIVL
ncbi:hypothetical protein J22TS3_32410 [Paenibacillus sp. J22TS3]|nr:hypothetical protein J22TS3_32410 [Paenibacillus sp. J22TS3]